MAGDRLILNRFSEVTIFNDERMEPALLVGACIRGHSTRYTIVDAKSEPELFERLRPFARVDVEAYALCTPMFGEDNPLLRRRFEPEWRPRLRALGLLVPRRRLPKRVRYEAPLGLEIPALAPRAIADIDDGAPDLVVNPGFHYVGAGELPPALRRRIRRFPCGYAAPDVWVHDAGTHVLSPYWVERDLAATLRRLVAGEALKRLSPEVIRALRAADVLIEPSRLAQRQESWRWLATDGAASLRERGFLVVKGALPPLQVAAFRRYYRSMIEQGFMPFVDRRNARRFVTHNEPAAMFFHHQLTALMQRAVGRALKPNQLAVSAYTGGAVLPIHTDGANSDWNISLQVDFAPEPDGETSWPLLLGEDPATGKPNPVCLALGDCVIYRGNGVPHGRPRLPRNLRSTTIVFHFGERS